MRAADRDATHPLVIAGGHAAFNPEPLADFLDAAVLGEGEEVVAEITEVVARWKAAVGPDGARPLRESLLRELAAVPGVYVPSMYEVSYDGPRVAAVRPRFPDVPATVDKRTVADLGE